MLYRPAVVSEPMVVETLTAVFHGWQQITMRYGGELGLAVLSYDATAGIVPGMASCSMVVVALWLFNQMQLLGCRRGVVTCSSLSDHVALTGGACGRGPG